MPDNMTMDDGSLLEPLCVGIHGARKSGVKAGSKMLILGAGKTFFEYKCLNFMNRY